MSNHSRDSMRVGMVIPRYGDFFGGAELLVRWFAERLVKAGHEVEVFTSCAVDHTTWRNVLDEGTKLEDGVLVNRFAADRRDLSVFVELERAITAGFRLTRNEEKAWLRNGIYSSSMARAISSRREEFDLILAAPYLFGTTHLAQRAAPERTVVIPCLHDEPYAYLDTVRRMLSSALGVMFNSEPEAELGHRIATIDRSAVVGVGIESAAASDPEEFRQRYGIAGGGPFVLYVGRLESGKNVPELLDYFEVFKSRNPSELKLVLVGTGDVVVPRRGDVMRIDVDWSRDRKALYSAATMLIHPSLNESFSIVLMQAWLAERPAVVHGMSPVTKYHVHRANGGVWYTNYPEFEEGLLRLLASEKLRDALGKQGRQYVEKQFSWDVVLRRFLRAAEAWKPPTAGVSQPASVL